MRGLRNKIIIGQRKLDTGGDKRVGEGNKPEVRRTLRTEAQAV